MSDEHRAGRHVQILHRGGGVVAIHKPAGLPTQAPPDLDSTERRVRSLVHGAARDGYLGVPHRLDRAVSGVMLFAETPRAARTLCRQYERRAIL
ncbi:MAG: pseudouridine synthase [Planctomycetaceae bacterium]